MAEIYRVEWSIHSLRAVSLVQHSNSGNHTQNLSDCNPLLPCNRLSMLVIQIDSIHELSIDVKLLVKSSTITDANGFAVSVSGKVTVLLLIS